MSFSIRRPVEPNSLSSYNTAVEATVGGLEVPHRLGYLYLSGAFAATVANSHAVTELMAASHLDRTGVEDLLKTDPENTAVSGVYDEVGLYRFSNNTSAITARLIRTHFEQFKIPVSRLPEVRVVGISVTIYEGEPFLPPKLAEKLDECGIDSGFRKNDPYGLDVAWVLPQPGTSFDDILETVAQPIIDGMPQDMDYLPATTNVIRHA